MPWKIFDGRCGSTSTVISDCPSMSMKPGATMRPVASMRSFAGASASRPIAAIRPFLMPTSAAYHGDPVPSTTCPFRITRSKGRESGVGDRDACGAIAMARTQRSSVRIGRIIKRWSTRGDVALAGSCHQTLALHPHFEAVRLAVEFLGDEAKQVLAVQLVGDPGENRRQVARRGQLEIAAAARRCDLAEAGIRT